VFADSPTPVQDSLDLSRATLSTLHIEDGGCVLYRVLARTLTPREIPSAEPSRLKPLALSSNHCKLDL
jgi:hypothetical protein